MPVVLTTRWFCSVIASAPPLHSALTTAWMSCWCTTSWSAVTSPLSTARSISSLGASLSTTVTAGPRAFSKPAGPLSWSTRRCRSVTCWSSTDLPRVSTSRLSWATLCCRSSARSRCCRTTVSRSVTLEARRSSPPASSPLVTSRAPATTNTATATRRQTRRCRCRCVLNGAPALWLRRLDYASRDLHPTLEEIDRVQAIRAQAYCDHQWLRDVRRAHRDCCPAGRPRHRLDRRLRGLRAGRRQLHGRVGHQARQPAAVDGRPEEVELRDRLRPDLRRPGRLRSQVHPARPRARRGGRDAGLLPDRAAVDRDVLLRQRQRLRPGDGRPRAVQP